MNSTQQKKIYTYSIIDEHGKELMVSFDHEHQVHNWISMELNIHGKQYKIIGIKTINK